MQDAHLAEVQVLDAAHQLLAADLAVRLGAADLHRDAFFNAESFVWHGCTRRDGSSVAPVFSTGWGHRKWGQGHRRQVFDAKCKKTRLHANGVIERNGNIA